MTHQQRRAKRRELDPYPTSVPGHWSVGEGGKVVIRVRDSKGGLGEVSAGGPNPPVTNDGGRALIL